MRLSTTERLIFINQYRILSKLEGSGYETEIKILECGFESEIDHLFSSIDAEGFSKEGCSEVIEILAMYDHFQTSLREVKDKGGSTDWEIKFRGFDEATEGKHWVYALHLVRDQQRFLTKVDDLKGYQPMLSVYREMVSLWKEARASLHIGNVNLSPDQIRTIIKPVSRSH